MPILLDAVMASPLPLVFLTLLLILIQRLVLRGDFSAGDGSLRGHGDLLLLVFDGGAMHSLLGRCDTLSMEMNAAASSSTVSCTSSTASSAAARG